MRATSTAGNRTDGQEFERGANPAPGPADEEGRSHDQGQRAESRRGGQAERNRSQPYGSILELVEIPRSSASQPRSTNAKCRVAQTAAPGSS